MLAPEAKRGGIYKRMETDAEYQSRLQTLGRLSSVQLTLTGRLLDEVGDLHGMQRRIVESSAD